MMHGNMNIKSGIYCLHMHGRRWLRSRPLKIYAAGSSKTDSTAKPTLWRNPDDPNLTHCGRVTQICVFNTVNLGTSASSP